MYKNRRRFQLKKQKATASVAPGKSEFDLLLAAVDVLIGATVTMVDALAPEGVTVAGVKVQAEPAGNDGHVKVIGELKPLSGVTVRTVLPFCPGKTDKAVGETEMEKSTTPEVAALMVYAAVAVALVA